MLELDGSAGGGQLLRTALALSAVTGRAFEMTGVRGARDDPGLRPQHVRAVELLAAVADADVEGADPNSTELVFDPGSPRGGRYEVEVTTAGSLTLLFDAVLPVAVAIEEPLVVAATGGTDVRWSPTAAHYRAVKLPLVRRHGLAAAVDIERPGFYPAGGGAATLHLAPSTPDGLALTRRGGFEGARVYATAATELADAGVARRGVDAAARELAGADLEVVERVLRVADADCPGAAVCVRLDYAGGVAGFDALGERGRPAEDVGRAATEAALAFEEGAGAVDRHLADQLVVMLAVAGGSVRIPSVTDHVRTAVDIVGAFGADVAVERRESGALLSARTACP